MCLTQNSSKSLTITYDYKVFSKPQLNLLTNKKLYWKSNMYRRNKNTALMFVRAPKHFKSGKQHIFFFNTLVRKKQFYNATKDVLVRKSKNILALYSLIKLYDILDVTSGVYISRITVEQSVLLNFSSKYNTILLK